ncbi:MAG: hypothetical protein PHN84_08445 [Desulfuromonadaceae bacterium]|nr:hypothetical protein [Desulfuromonadaceae bacterium]MDD2856095.1 hypothetical protein [Desulfuromonadaceae bacterium]
MELSTENRKNSDTIFLLNTNKTLSCRCLPKRFLFHQLIFILLFLSPLTFSNNDVPNFQPECEVASTLRSKAPRAAAEIISSPLYVRQTGTAAVSSCYSLSAPSNPTVEEISFISPSRAPPLSA